MRKGFVVVLILVFFGIAAYAFSSVSRDQWHSRLEKGEYRGTDEHSFVFVVVAVEEPAPPDVVISEPLQIIVATPDEVDVENIVAETEEIEGDHNEEIDPSN